MNIQTPEWVKHAVFYQIFPDRFRRSDQTRHARGIKLKDWGAPPEEQGYQGGDLYGVVDKLDYLKDLGVTAIYLNPIFSAASNHRYNAYNFLEVDPLLGGEAALRALLDEAHQRDMKIILDGVFNHCGRGFWAFHHIMENGGDSPYIDWFHVHDYPLYAYPNDADQKPNYASWWNHASLPKFNTDNPGVRDYIFTVTRHWLEFGADGWRLDVPEEIKDDSFWREFRQVVKSVNPEAYIVGEIWHEAAHWLQGDMFDAVMNYQATGPILTFFGRHNLNKWHNPDMNWQPIDAPRFQKAIETMLGWYDWEINTAQLNMLDSHDMPRALWLVKDDQAALQLSVLCQMTLPGAPCIYYGDEAGLSAGGDPYCREAFPWAKFEAHPHPLHDFYRRATALRHAHPALRTGDLVFLYADGETVAYRRRISGEEALVVFHAGIGKRATLRLSADKLAASTYQSAWPADAGAFTVADGALTLELGPQSALVLVAATG
jgi:neopullulanase